MTVPYLLFAVLICTHALFSGPVGLTAKKGLASLSQEKSNFLISTSNNAILELDSFNITSTEAVHIAQKSKENSVVLLINDEGKTEIFGHLTSNGSITLISLGSLSVSGTVQVPEEDIFLLADHIHISKSATLDVSSRLRGGNIYIGRDAQEGSTATSVIIEKGANITADAEEEGNGGSVIIWSDEKTYYSGHISSRGGSSNGDGGFIEVSTAGDSYLFNGTIDLDAPNGEVGSLLLDPKDVYIESDGTDSATGNFFSSDPSGIKRISGSALSNALNSGSVTIQVNNDLYIREDVTATTLRSNLHLQAGRSIINEATITLNQGNFFARVCDSNADPGNRDPGDGLHCFNRGKIVTQGGDILLQNGRVGWTMIGQILLMNDSLLDAGGGNIFLSGSGTPTMATGIAVNDSTIKTKNHGMISFYGQGGYTDKNGFGIKCINTNIQVESGILSMNGFGGALPSAKNSLGILLDQSHLTTLDGGILLFGMGGAGKSSNVGIRCKNFSRLETTDGDISLNGMGQGSGTHNPGVHFDGGSKIISKGTSDITINGTGGFGTDINRGIVLSGKGTQFVINNGLLKLQGDGKGFGIPVSIVPMETTAADEPVIPTIRGSINEGVRIELGAALLSKGNAPIQVKGIGGTGEKFNIGVTLCDSPNAITSKSGDIFITGDGDGSAEGNQGIRIEKSMIYSTGKDPDAANITLIGTGGEGTSQDNGIFLTPINTGIVSVDGNISLTGTAKGHGEDNTGVMIGNPNSVKSTGTGTVDITSKE